MASLEVLSSLSAPERRTLAISCLDFASPESGLGSKLGIDATDKWPPETKRDWGRKIRMSDDIVDLVTRRWPDYGLPGSGTPIWK